MDWEVTPHLPWQGGLERLRKEKTRSLEKKLKKVSKIEGLVGHVSK